MPNDAYDAVRKVYPQAHQTAAGIYDRDPTKSNSRYLGKDWNDARSHLLPAQLLGTCDLHGLEHPESIWCVRWTPLPAQPCDGDHASPPCADKDCWHRCPNCGGDPCLPNCKYGEAAQPAQGELLQGLAEPEPEPERGEPRCYACEQPIVLVRGKWWHASMPLKGECIRQHTDTRRLEEWLWRDEAIRARIPRDQYEILSAELAALKIQLGNLHAYCSSAERDLDAAEAQRDALQAKLDAIREAVK